MNQETKFLYQWFETTSQKFWFSVHFSKQKQWNWITCFEPTVSLPISEGPQFEYFVIFLKISYSPLTPTPPRCPALNFFSDHRSSLFRYFCSQNLIQIFLSSWLSQRHETLTGRCRKDEISMKAWFHDCTYSSYCRIPRKHYRRKTSLVLFESWSFSESKNVNFIAVWLRLL